MNSLQKLFEDAEYFCLKLRILLSATFLTDWQLNNRIHSVIVSHDSNIRVRGMCSMYVQCWRAATRCQTRQVREDSVMRPLDCQSPESSSLLSSSSLSSQSASVLCPARTHTSEAAGDTDPTSALTATVPDIEVAAATAITTDVQQDVNCSIHCASIVLRIVAINQLFAFLHCLIFYNILERCKYTASYLNCIYLRLIPSILTKLKASSPDGSRYSRYSRCR